MRIVIAMSGGVDSSVTAALMKEAGHECIGMHLHFWTDRAEPSEAHSKNKCCTLEGLEDARWACEKLNIPFYVMNVEAQFKEQVVDYFLEGYSHGKTPNPCIECNRQIKFGELLDRALELKADFLATGHYARAENNGLFMAKDKQKDQSYFLYTLTKEKLARVMFPLGGMLKSEVYNLAKKFGLSRQVKKPQSQGLCFFSEGNPKYFLERYLPAGFFKPGPIETVDGRVIGAHKGLPLYTIGQRSGLGIGGIPGERDSQPWYVVSIDTANNRLTVGRERDILANSIILKDVHFISGKRPMDDIEVSARLRHRGVLSEAVFSMRGKDGLLKGLEPLRAPASGQSAVFYHGEKVLGGGIIEGSLYPYGQDRGLSAAHRRSRHSVRAGTRRRRVKTESAALFSLG